MRGIPGQRDAPLRPVLEGRSVAQYPVLHIVGFGRGDQLGQRRRERRGQPGGGPGRSAGAGAVGHLAVRYLLGTPPG
jgi:hypothetical protein